MNLSHNLLRELFFYKDGKLFNKTQRNYRTKIGEEAGKLSDGGYRQITINRKLYYSHRLIYMFHHGEIPDGLHIDHIDKNRSNNNIGNLRLVTNQENHFNRSAKGYCFHKPSNKFMAYIKLNGKQTNLGLFNTKEEAHCAYLVAKKELHIIKER